MVEDDDDGYKTVAQQIFGRVATATFRSDQREPKAADEPNNEGPLIAAPETPPVEKTPAATEPSEPIERLAQPKQLMTPVELAEAIEQDLARHPNCPKAGFRVTVYGWPHWRAMLTIEPAAGPVRNPQEWRDLTETLAERLRKRFDLL